MNTDWYIGIRDFCNHWANAPMLQQTFTTLEREFKAGDDACIDAAKGIVECACRAIIAELDDPTKPLMLTATDTPIHELVGLATRLLKLGDIRHRKFSDLIKHHNNLKSTLRELRNEAGPISHGKEGFLLKLSEHHRRAAVLSADAIIAFLHLSYLDHEPDPANTNEPYERFTATNRVIDKWSTFEEIEGEEGTISAVVRLPYGERIPVGMTISRILFHVDPEGYKQAAMLARSAEMAEIAEPEDMP